MDWKRREQHRCPRARQRQQLALAENSPRHQMPAWRNYFSRLIESEMEDGVKMQNMFLHRSTTSLTASVEMPTNFFNFPPTAKARSTHDVAWS
jgi:hypothetical protein